MYSFTWPLEKDFLEVLKFDKSFSLFVAKILYLMNCGDKGQAMLLIQMGI